MVNYISPILGILFVIGIIFYFMRSGTPFATLVRYPDERDLFDGCNILVRGKKKPNRRIWWSDMRVVVTTHRMLILVNDDEATIEYAIDLVESVDAVGSKTDLLYAVRTSIQRTDQTIRIPIVGDFVRTHMGIPIEIVLICGDASDLHAALAREIRPGISASH